MMAPSPTVRRSLLPVRSLPLTAALLIAGLAAVPAGLAAAADSVVVPAGPGTTNVYAPAKKMDAPVAVQPGAPAAPATVAAPGAKPANSGPTIPGGKDNKQPVDVQADNAIEWHQDQKAYVARGNASAVRGTTTIYGDVLTAYYRESKEKGSDVYRMTAEGNVRIVSPTHQVFGDHGVWDNDKQFGVMTGQNLKLLTQTDIVTAKDSLEYYDGTKLAVARGDAIAVRNQDRMRADTIVALFKEDATGSLQMERLDGIGNVVITTPTDVALCKRVMYSLSSDIAVLVDDVKITRGDDQVNGDAAEMNMKTHVNRVLSGGRRVEGLLLPQDQNAAKPDASGKTPPGKTPPGKTPPGKTPDPKGADAGKAKPVPVKAAPAPVPAPAARPGAAGAGVY